MNLKLTHLSKRQKIIVASILITIGFIFATRTINLFTVHYRIILGLSVLSYILSLWALWEGMNKLKAFILLILPLMFTLAFTSFYFLLPIRWLTRLPAAIVFGMLCYPLLLAQNVFNVASERTIPLYRAASTVTLLFTLLTAFLSFSVIFSFRLTFYWNTLAVILVSFPLFLQMLWTIEMDKLTSRVLIYTLILSTLVGEFALVLSFWPLVSVTWALLLSTLMYVLLGVLSQFLRERLTVRLLWEYAGIGITVLLFTIIVSLRTG